MLFLCVAICSVQSIACGAATRGGFQTSVQRPRTEDVARQVRYSTVCEMCDFMLVLPYTKIIVPIVSSFRLVDPCRRCKLTCEHLCVCQRSPLLRDLWHKAITFFIMQDDFES
jgi:hypothetical protein